MKNLHQISTRSDLPEFIYYWLWWWTKQGRSCRILPDNKGMEFRGTSGAWHIRSSKNQYVLRRWEENGNPSPIWNLVK